LEHSISTNQYDLRIRLLLNLGHNSDISQYFEPTPGEPLSAERRLLCGACAGITSVTLTYPLDIVRTRLSIQSASFKELGDKKAGEKLPGMFSLMVTMYKTEGGWTALYRGIIPTIAGVAPYVCYISNDKLRMLISPGGTKLHGLRDYAPKVHSRG
jgi:solute carrier family 25 phosphate transporter 23/24/25/41